MDVIEQSLRIPAADVELDAEVVIPQPAQGVVLFAHGSGMILLTAGEQVAQLARDWFVRHLRGVAGGAYAIV